MGFHSRLNTNDLHAPSRLPVRNDNNTTTIATGQFAFVVNYSASDATFSALPISDFTSSSIGTTEILGVATEPINPGAEGFITTLGIVERLAITGVTDSNRGSTVYIILNTTNLGQLTLDGNANGATPVGTVLSSSTTNQADVFLFSLESGFIRTHLSGTGSFRGIWNPSTAALPNNSLTSTIEISVGDYFVIASSNAATGSFNIPVEAGDLFIVTTTPANNNLPAPAGAAWTASNYAFNAVAQSDQFNGVYSPASSTSYPADGLPANQIIEQGSYWITTSTIAAADSPFSEALSAGSMLFATLTGANAVASSYQAPPTGSNAGNFAINQGTGGGSGSTYPGPVEWATATEYAVGVQVVHTNLFYEVNTLVPDTNDVPPNLNSSFTLIRSLTQKTAGTDEREIISTSAGGLTAKTLSPGTNVTIGEANNDLTINAGYTNINDETSALSNTASIDTLTFKGEGVTASNSADSSILVIDVPGGASGTTYEFQDEGNVLPDQANIDKINFTGDIVASVPTDGDTLTVDVNACTVSGGTFQSNSIGWTLGTSVFGTTRNFNENNDGFRWSVSVTAGSITALCNNMLSTAIPLSSASTETITLTALTVAGTDVFSNVPTGERTGTGSLTFNLNQQIVNTGFATGNTTSFAVVGTFTVGTSTGNTLSQTLTYTNPGALNLGATLSATPVTFNDTIHRINVSRNVSAGTGIVISTTSFPNSRDNSGNASLGRTEIDFTAGSDNASDNGIRRDSGSGDRTLTETLTFTDATSTATTTRTYTSIFSLTNVFFFPAYSGSIAPSTTTITTAIINTFTQTGQFFMRPDPSGNPPRLSFVFNGTSAETTKIFAIPAAFQGSGVIIQFPDNMSSNGSQAPITGQTVTGLGTINTQESYDTYRVATNIPGNVTLFLEFR